MNHHGQSINTHYIQPHICILSKEYIQSIRYVIKKHNALRDTVGEKINFINNNIKIVT